MVSQDDIEAKTQFKHYHFKFLIIIFVVVADFKNYREYKMV